MGMESVVPSLEDICVNVKRAGKVCLAMLTSMSVWTSFLAQTTGRASIQTVLMSAGQFFKLKTMIIC